MRIAVLALLANRLAANSAASTERAALRIFLAGLCALIFALPAIGRERMPKFAEGTPYPTVRAQLVRVGFEPVRVNAARPEDSAPCPYPTAFCRAYPEVLACAVDGPFCTYLFRRRADGLLLVVQTAGVANERVRPADFSGIRFTRLYQATRADLEDVRIGKPTRRAPRSSS